MSGERKPAATIRPVSRRKALKIAAALPQPRLPDSRHLEVIAAAKTRY